MKVAILSMQDVFNFGSLLQAYGLNKIIKNVIPDAEVCYLSIEPNEADNSIATKAVSHHEDDKTNFDKYIFHRILNKFSNKKQNKIFLEFQSENFIKCEQGTSIDICVIGSDEVFNCCNADTWGFTTQLFGNVKNTKRVITYAASCGFATIEMTNGEMQQRIREAFTRISAFSVRDSGTESFVEKLTEKPVQFHMDPVLIADFDREINLVKNNVNIPDNLCIVYSYHNRIHDEMEIKEIKEFAKGHGLRLVTVGASQKWISDMLVLNPFEVLFVFSKAKFIITDTFHGTIFASKYNGRFATLLRKSNNNKLSDLVKRLDIEDHVISTFSELENAYEKQSSKEHVNEIIEQERIRTINYLKENLV